MAKAPLDYGSDPAKWEAYGRLEKLGAVIGKIDENSVHVKLSPYWGGTAIGDEDIDRGVQDINTLGNVGDA